MTCAALVGAAPAVAQDVVGSWRFDDGGGRVAVDDGPFGLHAVWPATGGPEWISGVSGTALRFDGDDDELAVPDRPALEPERITVSAWVRRTGSPGAYRYVFSKGATSCARSAYGLYTGASGGAAFYVSGNGAFTVSAQAPPSAVWDGRWHRLTGTYDGTYVRLHLDGTAVGTRTPGPTHIEYGSESRTPLIGSYRGGCRLPFDGDIDALAVWSGALSAARILADATPPPETPSSGPIGPAPGTPAAWPEPGRTTTPSGCTSVKLSRRSVHAVRRTSLVVTVRRGAARTAGVRVVVKARALRKVGRTNARGRVRFVVRASRRVNRLTVKVATARRAACGTPVAYVRVR